MAEEVLSDIEELGEEGFQDFAGYLVDVSEGFFNDGYEGAERLSEAGGNPSIVGKLNFLFLDVEESEEYVQRIRAFKDSSYYNSEAVERTVEELFSGFFEEGDSKYILE